MRVFPVVLLLWAALPGAATTCTTAYGDKIRYCKTFQTDYIEGIEILIFEEGDVGRINSTIFSSPSLKSVRSLTLKGSKIHTIDLGAFQQFWGLTNIELQDNSLGTLSPSWFHDPAALKNLTVASNAIGRLRPEMLQGFINLERLNLSRNQITSIHSESFWNLSKMASLDLSYNQISSLEPQALRPLNTTLRLGGNPWDCSCAQRDFMLFLKELVNASRLADPTAVTCRSPPDMMGTLVWNASEMNCSSPAPPPSPEAVFHNAVLSVLFVVLALFLFISLIFLLWKKKQDKKQVQPDKRTRAEANTRISKISHPTFADVNIVNSNMMGFKTALTQNPTALGRAKSAAAILLQGEFNSSTLIQREKRNEKSQCCDTSKDGRYPKETSERNMEMWYYNSLQSKVYQTVRPVLLSSVNVNSSTTMEDTSTHTPIVSMGPEENDHSTRSTTNIDEPFVYLCINTTQEDSTATIPVKNSIIHNKPRIRRRALSWPNVQYKADPGVSYNDFLKTLNISEKTDGSHTTQERSKQTFQKWDLGIRSNPIQELGDSKAFLRKVDVKKGQALGGSSKSKVVDIKSVERQPRNTTSNVYQRSSKSRHSSRKTVNPLDSGVNRDHLHSQGSEASSGLRRTPDDDQLLENNEYNFIDLLHEVVENHGRWTRERWKQTHQHRMSSRTSPHS